MVATRYRLVSLHIQEGKSLLLSRWTAAPTRTTRACSTRSLTWRHCDHKTSKVVMVWEADGASCCSQWRPIHTSHTRTNALADINATVHSPAHITLHGCAHNTAITSETVKYNILTSST